jgi:hypothetical protein
MTNPNPNPPPEGAPSPTTESTSEPTGGATKETPPAAAPPATPGAPAATGLSQAELVRLNQLYAQTIKDQGKKLSDLDKQMQDMRKGPPPSQEEMDKNLWARPTDSIRGIVREELEQSVAPLRQFVSTFQGADQYSRAKNKFKNDPRYKPVFDKAEAYIDEMMKGQNYQSEEELEGSLRATLLSVVGAVNLGLLPGVSFSGDAPVTTPPSGGGSMTTPAHIPPSPPPGAPPKTPARRELTENERRLAREWKMTPEEFLDWQDLDSTKVASSTIGIMKEEKK